MRKSFSAVAVGVFAVLVGACSSDATGPNLGPQYGAGYYQRSTESAPEEKEGKLSQCGWDALRRADGQDIDKSACHGVNQSKGDKN